MAGGTTESAAIDRLSDILDRVVVFEAIARRRINLSRCSVADRHLPARQSSCGVLDAGEDIDSESTHGDEQRALRLRTLASRRRQPSSSSSKSSSTSYGSGRMVSICLVSIQVSSWSTSTSWSSKSTQYLHMEQFRILPDLRESRSSMEMDDPALAMTQAIRVFGRT